MRESYEDLMRRAERLGIDIPMRDLIVRLWQHKYETAASCDGAERGNAYVIFRGGDGWFEEHARDFGLEMVSGGNCCIEEFLGALDEFRGALVESGAGPRGFRDRRKCCGCGAGVNGYIAYRGRLLAPEGDLK